ncbi:MAG: hypothetical protein MOB07_31615 [Acidobacteria bacterium]|nr:hypothetical protein [Acidobacteriota bacterium]
MPEGDNNTPPLAVMMEKQEHIPEMYRELYTEQNGKWILTGITGVKTQADVDYVKKQVEGERDAHKKTKDRMRPFIEYNDEQIKGAQEWLDKRQETEAQIEAAGKTDDEKINKLVESRINTRLAPVERAKGEVETKLTEANKVIATLAEEKRIRIIHDAVREQRGESKYIDTAEEDILMVAEKMLVVGEDGKTVTTKEGGGVTPGIPVKDWLVEMMPKRTHWWPVTEGGGAKGGKNTPTFTNNPWEAANWNITKQGQVERDDPKLAEQMRKSAGVELGATKPRVKK